MRSALLAVMALFLLNTAAFAQPTAFTYQGSLTDGGQAVSGPHDLRFRLMDAASGGGQVGVTLCREDVAVTGGFFSVVLDFGPQFGTPAPRFLEVDVRPDIGQPCTDVFGYVALGPRQLVTATPLAIHAQTATALHAPDGSPANAVMVDNNGRVGVGTVLPFASLHVVSNNPVMVLQDSDDPSVQSGYLGFWSSSGTESAWLGYGTPGSPHFSIMNQRNGGNVVIGTVGQGRVTVTNTGFVGIGTASPAAMLDVRGNIRLGNSTIQYNAAAGDETLRIVRGNIDAAGSLISGGGITVSHLATGDYRIFFNNSFTGTPSVTATADLVSIGVIAMVDNVITSSARVRLFTRADGAPIDGPFSFIAVGPR
jgi:hypothetical protein